jgi:glycosyltransferase involved in cell wall biosynthesis
MAIEHVERLKSQLKTDYEFKLTYKKISEIEKNVFESCKYFMYPSEESLEPYYETISNFGDMIENKNIYYNMTGCKKLTKEGSKKDFCKKNHIDEKSFIVLFVGRHNNVKGYKVFCDTFNKISNLVRNITFVSAGIGNIKSPNHKNFVDIGWTEDPGSLISASDLFVLPNNRTFFDLIMLEVLSLGKPILASNTGGNKTISKLDSGVVLFNRGDENDLSNKILELKNDKELLEKLGNKNLSLYNSYFTLEKFAERYNELAIKMSDVALSLKNNRD